MRVCYLLELRYRATKSETSEHLKPELIGKRVTDLLQTSYIRSWVFWYGYEKCVSNFQSKAHCFNICQSINNI